MTRPEKGYSFPGFPIERTVRCIAEYLLGGEVPVGALSNNNDGWQLKLPNCVLDFLPENKIIKAYNDTGLSKSLSGVALFRLEPLDGYKQVTFFTEGNGQKLTVRNNGNGASVFTGSARSTRPRKIF